MVASRGQPGLGRAVCVGANPKRIPKLLVFDPRRSVVMAFASVLPSGGTTSVLLEREDHVASPPGTADTARAGGGRLVVIEGTAGIGKTRLLGEVRAIADSAGMRVLAARGGELEGEFAYGIVRQLFEPLLASVLQMSAKSCSRGLPRL